MSHSLSDYLKHKLQGFSSLCSDSCDMKVHEKPEWPEPCPRMALLLFQVLLVEFCLIVSKMFFLICVFFSTDGRPVYCACCERSDSVQELRRGLQRQSRLCTCKVCCYVSVYKLYSSSVDLIRFCLWEGTMVTVKLMMGGPEYTVTFSALCR